MYIITTLLKEFALNLVLGSLELGNLFRKFMSPDFGDTNIFINLPPMK